MLDEFDINLNAIISSLGLPNASNPTGMTKNHLSKIWRIDANTAEKTLDVTTQLLRRSQDSTLLRNYTTGDQMLHYKRINLYFFIDNFFVHNKKGKPSRGYTFMQLFVTDKGFVHVIPMNSKSEVPIALKCLLKTSVRPMT